MWDTGIDTDFDFDEIERGTTVCLANQKNVSQFSIVGVINRLLANPMETPDLDPLLHRLRHHTAPASLGANVISRLGPPARQIQTIFLGGVCACLAGILLSTAITLEVARERQVPAPPLLGLFSEDIGPFASL